MRYKHYSFDLWGTLIKSNPQFKMERACFFEDYYNPKKLPTYEVESITRHVDKICNHVNEVVGGNITSEEMYSMVLYKLGIKAENITPATLSTISHSCNQLFEQYPPVVFHDDTFQILKDRKDTGCTLSILSNTAFIKGSQLRIVVENLFPGLFDLEMYSDEEKMSKPNPILYTRYVRQILSLYYNQDRISISRRDFLHVGDNMISDIQGAKSAHIDSFLINSNNKTIQDISWHNTLSSPQTGLTTETL